MKKGLLERKFNTIYIIVVTFLYVAGMLLLISSKGIEVLGYDYPKGVNFSYKGTEYKVFMMPTAEMNASSSKKTMIIPGEEEYRLVEDSEFCDKYELWTGRCDCDGDIGEMDGQVTFTMNWTGEPKEYTFDVLKYANRSIDEVVYIINEDGYHGYGYATNILTKEKR